MGARPRAVGHERVAGMTGCFPLDIPCHVSGWLAQFHAFMWPWGYLVAAIVALGAAYRLAGWPGVLALATGGAYLLGRWGRKPEAEPTRGDFAPTPKPVRGPKRDTPPKPTGKTLADRIREKWGL